MADLCTLADVKLARRGLPSALDDMIEALIPRASAAIESWTGRQFSLDDEASVRYFAAPGFTRSRIVPIDDLSAAPTVATVVDAYGDTFETFTVATDLVLLPRNRRVGAPIDAVLVRPDHSIAAGHELALTGIWGFPAVPPEAEEACIETVVEWLKASQGVTTATPDSFEPGGFPTTRGLPTKARDLLRPFRRIGVA